MSDKVDLNISNYSLEDLIGILNIEPNMTQEEVLEKGKELIGKYIDEEKPKYAEFFSKGLKKILENFSQVENILESEDNDAEKVLQDQYYDNNSTEQTIARLLPNRRNNINIVNDIHSTQSLGKLLQPEVVQAKISQGTLNPNLKNIYTSWINIDSHFREIRIVNDSISCDSNKPAPASNQLKMADESTDFTAILSQTVTNVTSIGVHSVEIPVNAYYPVSTKYGTNNFYITNDSTGCCIKLHSAFYPLFKDTTGKWESSTYDASLPDELKGWTMTEIINKKISDCGFNDITFHISPNTQKASFINTGGISITIVFYDLDNTVECKDSDTCIIKNKGQKIDSSLGWLLGFRQAKYTIEPSGTITGEDVVNPWGTRYFFLEVDDQNNNRTTGQLISTSADKDMLNLPNYYKKTMNSFAACRGNTTATGVALKRNAKASNSSIRNRSCRKGTPAGTQIIDGSNNLTTAQKYTITEILNRRQTQNQKRYTPPTNSNILFRIPVSRFATESLTGMESHQTIINNEIKSTMRNYFGPVNLSSLKIRLINDKGYPVDLNSDWSISMLANRLYQY